MILWVSMALAVPPVHSAPWDKSGRIDRAIGKYSKGRVETVSGTVERIYEKVPSFGKKKNDALGFHLILDTGKEKIDIHLGPAWYLKGIEERIDRGDTVEIVGSVDEAHPPADGETPMKEIRASEVRRRGVVVLKLRDDEGRPLWSDH